MVETPPILVSVGVPVYNGEKGIARALDSVVGQDYPHLEIIISDNGSTDRTREICEAYAKRDPRIRYHREEKNRGATWNFNRVFDLSTGKYFMWAAHDDVRELSFVSTCVEKLESCPDAVLCQAHTSTTIEGRDEIVCICDLDTFEGVEGLVERYRETLRQFPATAIYGVYRSSAVRKTQVLREGIATDIAFIQELSIHGDFVQVPRVLFTRVSRPKWNTIHDDYRAFFGKGRKPWWYLPFVSLFLNNWKRVSRAELSPSTKAHLWWALAEHEAARLSARAVMKASGKVCPEKWKEALGTKMYWWWLHSPNVKVSHEELFMQRIIKPMVGWWSD